ncbi:MAG: hypothetical protein ACKV19_13640 [Verrucomicrobiales bacterium]
MKRISENLAHRSAAETGAGQAGRSGWRRRLWRLAMGVGVAGLTGCAGFERDWKRAVGAPTRGVVGAVRGVGVEGAWQGTWTSASTGHTGALRCVVGAPPGLAGADSSGAGAAHPFTYHATWAIFSGTFPTSQPVQPQADGSWRSEGTWTLPAWAGGEYEYHLTIRENSFSGTWKSRRESGTVEMTRASAVR